MALSKEQFMELRRKGLSVEQIVSFESGEKPAGAETRQQKITRFQSEAQGFRDEAKKKGSFGGLLKGTIKGLPKATFEVGVGTPAKFLTSIVEAPKAAITGKASQRTYDLPGLEPFKSFQSEAETRAGKIIEGEKPLYTAISPFVEVPLAGIEALFIGKGISKGIKATQKIRSAGDVKRVAQAVFSPTSKKEKVSAFKKAGQPGGVTEKGITKKIVYTPTKQDIVSAKIVQGTIRAKSSPIKNITRINQRVEDVSQGVESFLKTAKTNKKISVKSLSASLDNIKPSLTTKTDATLNRTFNEVKRVVKDVVSKAGDNSYDMWKARIKLDKLMEGEFTKIFGNPERYTSTKDAYLQMRRTINKFIEVRTVGGDVGFTKGMKELSTLYESSLRLAEKNYKLYQTNAFQRFFKMHPILRKAAWFGVAGAAGGAGASILK